MSVTVYTRDLPTELRNLAERIDAIARRQSSPTVTYWLGEASYRVDAALNAHLVDLRQASE